MSDYCTVADVKALAGASKSTDDTLIGTLITRASKMIDTYTGRTFAANSVTRYYTPGVDTDGQLLFLSVDMLSITTLTNDGVEIPAAGYTLLPLNATAKRRLKLKSDYSWTFPDDPEGSIVVAGSQGFSTTPPSDIVQAATRLALWLYRQREAPFSRVGNAITGEYEVPVELPDDIKGLLHRYRRLSWGAA